MDKEILATINNEKDSTLTLGIIIEGVDTDERNVRLLIALDNPAAFLLLQFEAKGDDDYKVTIPAKTLSIGVHECVIEVVAKEHFFVAMTGKIKITGTPKIKAQIKETDTVEVKKQPEVKVETSSLRVDDEVVEQEVDEVSNQNEGSSIVLGQSHEPLSEDADVTPERKDDQVKKILGELGIGKKAGRSLKDYLKA